MGVTLLGLAALSTGANAGEEKKLTEQQVPKPVLEAFGTLDSSNQQLLNFDEDSDEEASDNE